MSLVFLKSIPSVISETTRNSRWLGIPEIVEELAPFDPRPYSRLKDLRNRLAKAQGVPLYGVFSNKTLEAFTRLRPTTVEAGMRIKGVGAVKAERYLEPFLELLREEGG